MGGLPLWGGVLLQAGDVRIMGPHAYLLIHEVSAGTSGKLSVMSENIAFWKRQEASLVTILAQRSSLTEAQIKRRWLKTDWWLDAAQAIALGFADDVLKPEHLASPAVEAPAAVETSAAVEAPLAPAPAETDKPAQ